ncbi:FAD-dependent urate hydroxylase HpxO [Mangrovicoccus algicola]|uniref:FAD-dependent urate hydroxylase n=1 Tax=Mangrovicoccus algicola TaxID=2771008 RepID=A0A8J7CJ30_9RHOB|nr:FAD-dependent urate hydroxylase HpxO [Mangrovicoccus algicola]MBE3640320.1 FAD-dependent urate hydroxylase HpxO [Mangrovicoccus algicola]
MKAIIVGAGIGGLSAGIALRRTGWDVTIYERVTEVKPVGAAISVWSNGVKCLNYLGLGAEVAKLGGRMDNMAYIDGLDGTTMTRFSFAPLVAEVGQRPYPVSRAELQMMLMEAFGDTHLHLGRQVTEVAQDGDTVIATLEDGTTDTADLLIGADGARSVVRTHVLGAAPERRYAGYVNWNGLVPVSADLAPDDQWTVFVGEGKRVSLMPISDGRFYFFFDTPGEPGETVPREAFRDTLRAHFDGWAEPVQRLIAAIDPERTNRVEIHDIDPFHTWVKGRIALLGDSAHNTTPDIGQGGCLAMEDAVVLAIALQTNTLGVEDALGRYQARRSGRAADLVMRARKRCDVTHAADPQKTRDWYDELRREDGTKVMRGIISNIEGNPLG